MRLTFLVSLLAMTLLFVTLWKLELTSKHAAEQLKRLRARLELAAEEPAGSREHGARAGGPAYGGAAAAPTGPASS